MSEIQNETDGRGFYKLLLLPTLGYLSRNGVRMVTGDRFSQHEINSGLIRYTHTVAFEPGETEAEDSFKFTLWDSFNENITADSYSSCFPIVSADDEPPVIPEDGVYEFLIHIRRPTNPTVEPWTELIIVREETSTPLTYQIQASEPGYSSDDIVHTLIKPMTNGFIRVRGITSKSFTQADVDAGDVVYVNTALGDGTDTIWLKTCNLVSRCVESKFEIQIEPKFRQIGDNIIYGPTGGVLHWEFQTNALDALWELRGFSLVAPQNSKPRANYIIEWSTYTETNTLPVDSPERGHGFDKLIEYRNLKEKLYWDGGLPLGVFVSSVGYLSNGDRSPVSQAGSQPWKLPSSAGSYPFTLTAYNPRTGESDIRRYMLVVTDSGLSIDGMASESRVL